MPRGTIDTPPADLRRLIPKLTPLIEELARLRAEAAVAVAAVDEAKRALQDAEQADRQALADRARGRLKREPKPTTSKAREDARQVAAKAAGLQQAADDAEADLRAAVEEHRSEYVTNLDVEAKQARERSQKTARKLAQLEAARAQLLALRRWLDDGRYTPGKSRSPSLDLRRPSGEPYTLGELLPLIESTLAPPVEQPKPEVPPLLRVTR